jgi:hypothetical protein
MNGTRGLTVGDLVTVPASYRVPRCRDRRTAVVESVAADGLSFCDTTGIRHLTADAELVPLAGTVPDLVAA